MFMPERPYLPLGTLRAAVCYPDQPGHFDEAAVVAALERVDLGHLLPSPIVPSVGTDNCRWTSSSAWRFRLLLQAPRWVVPTTRSRA